MFKYHSDDSNSLNSNWETYLYVDQKGTMWIVTDDGILYTCDAEKENFKILLIDSPNTNQRAIVANILMDRNRLIGVGTAAQGLITFNLHNSDNSPLTFTFIQYDATDPNSLGGASVNSIYEDRSGTLWIGTQKGGLNKFLNNNQQTSPTLIHCRFDSGDPFSIRSDNLSCWIEDKFGRLWIGSYNGLDVLDCETEKFTCYKNDPNDKNILSYNAITSFYENRLNSLWIGTTNKLNRLVFNDSLPDPPNVVITDLRLFNNSVSIKRKTDDPFILEKAIDESPKIKLSHRDKVISFEFAALQNYIPERNQYAFKLEGIYEDWNYIGNQRSVTFSDLTPGN